MRSWKTRLAGFAAYSVCTNISFRGLLIDKDGDDALPDRARPEAQGGISFQVGWPTSVRGVRVVPLRGCFARK